MSPHEPPTVPTVADIRAAATRIAPFVHRTPVFTSRSLDRIAGARLSFKCENLQRVGAFKARGALNAVLSLPDEVAARGVVTHSSGNHGQALAFAAGVRGIPCHVVMPENASPVKVAAVAGYGAEVVFCAPDRRAQTADEVARRTGAVLVHPFDDLRVIAGQGTAMLELVEQAPDLDAVVAPIGGGGLLSGTAIAATAAGIDDVVGAEPEAADDAARSLASGVRLPAVPDPQTIADGLRTGIGALPFRILTDLGAEIITVTEEQIAAAGRLILERMKLVVEPSAATPLAAVLARPDRFADRRVGIILSGGNTDLRWLCADLAGD